MTDLNRSEDRDRRSYRMVLLLLVALAALSSAMRDLDRLQEFTHGLEELALGWTDGKLFAVSAAGVSASEKSCSLQAEQSRNDEEFRWNGRLEPGKTIEVKGISGDIRADGTQTSEVEVFAIKRSGHGDPKSVTIKVVEHAGGVTICAVYPTDNPAQTTGCEPGEGGDSSFKTDSSRTNNVRNNSVAVDFTIRVPVGVDFAGRTINGGIKVDSLAGNVLGRTVNGSISISTSGYATARTVNGEISAKLGNSNWPGSLEFKTINGEINLDLPAGTNTSVKANTFNGEVSSDFPLTMLGRSSRKELSGTIGSGGRELILKTLNGSINLKRAG
jgi:Putative adhesin